MPDTAGWVTPVIVIAGFVFQIVREMIRDRARSSREERQRTWDVADRAQLAVKVKDSATALAAKVEQSAVGLAETVIKQHAELTDQVVGQAHLLATQIADNTDISTKAAEGADRAYHEANAVNAKIKALGLENNAINAQMHADVKDMKRRAGDR